MAKSLNAPQAAVAVLAACVLAAHPARLQSASVPPSPQFEVASIKVSDPASRGIDLTFSPGGRFTTRNATLKDLIKLAWDIRDNQISGGPSWLDSARWNIEAKPEHPAEPGPGADNPLRRMIQALLTDRFKLAVHRETREQQIYALVVSKSGSKLKAVEAEGGGPRRVGFGRGQITGQRAKIALLSQVLSNTLGRLVTDETGLTGVYDFKLEWTPDESQIPSKTGGDSELNTPPPPDSSGPSIFTALQEQLGLKLEPRKGPVEVLVIDRAEKAVEN